MDAASLRQMLDDVAAGRVHPDDAVTSLRRLPFADLGHARVDHHRAVRQGRAFSVVVATAGTADLAVADECAAVLAAHGIAADRLTDVGVAGVHRLLQSVDLLAEADVVVVAAGMEGALASLVGGITGAPVIAIPTSVGYGAAFEGVTALLAMLSSCAAGVTVVGIDNGYGAAAALLRLLPPAPG